MISSEQLKKNNESSYHRAKNYKRLAIGKLHGDQRASHIRGMLHTNESFR